MFSLHPAKPTGLFNFSKRLMLHTKLYCLFAAAVAVFTSTIVSRPVNGENFLDVFDPEYGDCGNVVINGVVNTDEEEGYRIFGLVWDWGDGQQSLFPERFSAPESY
jgi:hypothetical protein